MQINSGVGDANPPCQPPHRLRAPHRETADFTWSAHRRRVTSRRQAFSSEVVSCSSKSRRLFSSFEEAVARMAAMLDYSE
ncbi:hypothetical protein CSUI_002235 [Cystoisospora suis]|uniref:Uncharacterized protein n=1 Tax=Cystoisospora suis TaxID=483139 RepID=A0A2C6L9S1_9APIC|nr:hypothetical protein CSUI_002235 [Cystoisospora suis]